MSGQTEAEYGRRVIVGLSTGIAWIVGLFAAEPLVGGFAVVALAESIIVSSPGWLSTFAVSLLGFYAKPTLVAGVVIGILGATTIAAVGYPRGADRAKPIAILFGVIGTVALFLSVGVGRPFGLLAGLVVALLPPYLVVWSLTRRIETTASRQFLRRLGTTAAAAGIGLGAVRLLFQRSGTAAPGTGGSESERASEQLERSVSPPSGDPRFDFDGMPPAVTPPEDHYVVDINVSTPRVDLETWTLEIDGAVGSPQSLTYDELLDHPDSVEQTATMVCISNKVGGDLIGTPHWTGIPLSALVQAAEPEDGAVDVVTHSVDGYSEAIPIDLVEREDILLAYGMGEQTLASEHGFPVRLLIPGRYGMKMTKWITRIEISEADHNAYWEQRGWDEEAVANPMSYVRGAERDGDQVLVGGVAFAGLETGVEEIAAVEVSVDGGESWTEAELEPQLGPHAWRRWRYAFEAPEQANFPVVVRAVLRDGTVQTDQRTSPQPSGATGWHRMTVRV